MAVILKQQRLLLEWLVTAGNIAVSDTDNGSLLFVTQNECAKAGWINLTPFGSGFLMAAITDAGRDIVKDRRAERQQAPGQDRRRQIKT